MTTTATLDRKGSAALFVPGGGHRVRRPGDGAIALGCAASLVVLGLIAVPLSGFEQAAVKLIDALPGWFDVLWRLVLLGAAAWCLFLAIAALLRRRGAVLRDLAVASVLAVGFGIVLGEVVTGDGGSGFVLFEPTRAGSYPSIALAAIAAVVATGRPHVTEPYRRIGRWLVLLATWSTLDLQLSTPVGAAMALLLAGLCAALVHLGLGTNEGVPDPASVRESLAQLGLVVEDLRAAGRQRAGVFTLQGRAQGHPQVLVKVYGRDARDTQALARMWRGLWYRNSEALSLGRAQQVEREAFVALLLASRGVPVPGVLVAGVAGNDDALLALAPRGAPIEDDLTDAELASMWRLLGEVHAANLSFGDLSIGNFRRGDGYAGSPGDTGEPGERSEDRHPGGAGVCFGELATVSSSTSVADRLVDEAQLLVASTAVAGRDRSVQVARDQLGEDGLAEVLAYLQPAALGSSGRAAARAAKVKVAELRSSIAQDTGVEAPRIAKLRRVSSAALARMALLTFVAYAVISAVTKVDTEEMLDTFRSADWAWVVLALLVAQAAIASQSVTTQGASPRHIPFGPLALLQFAIAFIALAIPSSAARVAMVIRFFQRHGVAPAAATAVSLLDSFSGFLVQITLLVLVLGVGVGDVHLDFSLTSRSGGATAALVQILLLAAVVVVVLAVLALVLPGIRHRIGERVRPWVSDMTGTVRGVRSPRRLAQLLGGNLLTELVFALCLGACVQAFSGTQVTLAEMLVVYIGAALFGGFMPVPGGIGVMEAALTAGLEAVGVQSAEAFGAAITFRLCTFYLPPAWGAVAFGGLQRRGDL